MSYFASRDIFPATQKTRRIVTCLYIDCWSTLVFTHVHFVGLLSGYPLGCGLDSSSDEGITLSRVSEIFATNNFGSPFLLNKSVDEGSIVIERGPEDGREHACGLRREYVL